MTYTNDESLNLVDYLCYHKILLFFALCMFYEFLEIKTYCTTVTVTYDFSGSKSISKFAKQKDAHKTYLAK